MYHQANIIFSPAQGRKLINGHNVQFKKEQLMGSGAKTIHLDDEQSKKYMNAVHSGSGMRLHFKHEHQLHHNLLHGKGFHELLSKAKKVALHHLSQASQHASNFAQHTLMPAAKSYARDKLQQYEPQIRHRAHEYGTKLLDSSFGHLSQYDPNINQYRGVVDNNLHSYINDGLNSGLDVVNSQLGEGVNWGIVNRKFKNSMKDIGRTLRPIAKPILNGLNSTLTPMLIDSVATMTGQPALLATTPLAQQAISNGINKSGLGLKRRTAKKITGSSLNPSGSGVSHHHLKLHKHKK